MAPFLGAPVNVLMSHAPQNVDLSPHGGEIRLDPVEDSYPAW